MLFFAFKKELKRSQYLFFSIGTFLVFFLIWSILSYGGLINPFFLPTPTTIIETIYDLWANHSLLTDIWASVYRVLVAFAISAIIAIPLGILMSSFKIIEAIAEPPVDFIRYLPVPALVPLMILWLGIGEASKIMLLFIGTFFQLVLLVMDDANNVPKEYFELASTLGARRKDIIIRVLLPAIWPNIYDNLRVTIGWCWTYLLIGEIVASRTGLGHLIQEAQRFAKPQVVMAGILIIGVIGLLTDYSFKVGSRLLFKYKSV
jgi:NitT/TauT family transport system permease protein